MSALFLGLISGTSADGIDAALVRFDPALEVLAALTAPYPPALRERLLALTTADAAISIDEFGALDVAVGECAAAPMTCWCRGYLGRGPRHQLTRADRSSSADRPPISQIGDASVIAERTGICTIADFRRADVAAGGQGAPLAPALHAAIFADHMPCVVLNLGGIANLSLLTRDGGVIGFDSGPANCLLDAWNARHRGSSCDLDGRWAASGTVDAGLLDALLRDPYFSEAPPKSTGREYFNLDWLDAIAGSRQSAAADVQATLMALSVRTIADAVQSLPVRVGEALVCGGGVHNAFFMRSLQAALAPVLVRGTASAGIDPDHVEAILFAWLARERLAERAGNLVSVTGARDPRVLGAIHAARRR
jgi:anhydro-N-acetylmuramic acid kinase